MHGVAFGIQQLGWEHSLAMATCPREFTSYPDPNISQPSKVQMNIDEHWLRWSPSHRRWFLVIVGAPQPSMLAKMIRNVVLDEGLWGIEPAHMTRHDKTHWLIAHDSSVVPIWCNWSDFWWYPSTAQEIIKREPITLFFFAARWAEVCPVCWWFVVWAEGHTHTAIGMPLTKSNKGIPVFASDEGTQIIT